MSHDNAKIVEMSAYAPLTTSTIIGTLHIPVENILILKDQDSFFETMTKVVKAEEYEVKVKKKNKETNKNEKVIEKRKKCVVTEEKRQVKNTIWDGMALIEADSNYFYLPSYINGMVLLRNHLFKACAFKCYLQKFFKDWCKKNGYDYNTYQIQDMFGKWHYLKDIKMITTDNAIKWKKFQDLMGSNIIEAYEYWCERIHADGDIWGVVKTDHPSKLGQYQQLSYQMINTLPCTKDGVKDIAQISIDYVELLKKDNNEFEKFLRKYANEVNHYQMLADLYAQNHEFGNSKFFRYEKKEIIKQYVFRMRKGKIMVNGDNLTVCGNPYALLLYSVGEDFEKDPTLSQESNCIQCYTKRFDDNEYLAAFRNPHNSPNNVCYLHNLYSDEMDKYFAFSKNIMAVNCIHTDIQDRANGMDEDSDFTLDKPFWKDYGADYKITSAYLRDGSQKADAVQALKNEDVRTVVVSDDYSTSPIISYAGENITQQKVTSAGITHTFSDDLKLRSMETALGYSNITLDLLSVTYPETEQDSWEKMLRKLSPNLTTFWKPFEAFTHTTLSESDQRIRRFLAIDYEQERQNNNITVKVDNFDQQAWFVLRLNGETVKSVKGGKSTRIEDGAYLICAEKDTITIKVGRKSGMYYGSGQKSGEQE